MENGKVDTLLDVYRSLLICDSLQYTRVIRFLQFISD